MIAPVEMRQPRPMTLHGGASSTTTEVWEMLSACRDGDLDRMLQLIAKRPDLSTCQYNYTPPLHFAVREGHLPLVRVLVERKALDPSYKTYPFGDSLLTMAQDRGHDEIALFLQDALARPELTRKWATEGRNMAGSPAVSTLTRWKRHVMCGQGWAASYSISSLPCACSSDIPC